MTMPTGARSTRRQVLMGAAAAAAGRWEPGGRRVSAQERPPLPDVVVLLPGIMGSVLRKDNRDVWALSGGAILSGLRTLGGSVRDLALRGDPPDVDDLGDGITADRIFPDTHLIPGLWKIDGYSRISRFITDTFDARPGRNFFEFPYDWRRDNRVAARRLARLSHGWLKAWRESSGHRDARLVLIAHSMGGLVSRHFLEVLGGWRDTRMLITFGTPYRGSLNALNFLANGIARSLGPFTLVDLSGLVRSFTSVYQLLPIYPCYDPGDGRLRRVAETRGIPHVDATRAASALAFHADIRAAVERNARDAAYAAGRYTLHPIVGTYQPTLQVGRLAGGRVDMSVSYPGERIQGDGTVPEVSATPIEPALLAERHKRVFVAEIHGSLQNSSPMLDHVRGLLAEGAIHWDRFRAPSVASVALVLDDVYSTAEAVRVRARCEDARAPLEAVAVEVPTGREVARRPLRRDGEDMQQADLGPLAEGTYRVRVGGGPGVGSASDVFVVTRP
jgi:hypothetical protein